MEQVILAGFMLAGDEWTAVAGVDNSGERSCALQVDLVIDDHVADAQIGSREAFGISCVGSRVGPP